MLDGIGVLLGVGEGVLLGVGEAVNVGVSDGVLLPGVVLVPVGVWPLLTTCGK